jgi:hypothetical protein
VIFIIILFVCSRSMTESVFLKVFLTDAVVGSRDTK